MKPAPKVARKGNSSSKPARNVAGAMKLFDSLMAEKKPKVSAEVVAIIEAQLREISLLSTNRRMALMYLSKTFKETAKMVREDRETAVNFAAMGEAIESSVEKFESLVELLTAAQTRIQLQLCQREDMQEVLAEGKTHLTDNFSSVLGEFLRGTGMQVPAQTN
jgi:hypothetical protein